MVGGGLRGCKGKGLFPVEYQGVGLQLLWLPFKSLNLSYTLSLLVVTCDC